MQEVPDEQDVDVADLMRRVREKVIRRVEHKGFCSTIGQDEAVQNWNSECQKDMDFVRSNWDTQNQSYVISSHRKVTGKVLVKGRKMVHGEVRRYVDPIFFRQREFNASVSRLLDHAIRESETATAQLEEVKDDQMNLREDLMKAVGEQISQAKVEIDELMEERQRKLEEKLGQGGERRSWGDFYNKEIAEEDLMINISHHQEFMALVKEFALKAAGQRVPRLLEVGLGTATMSIYLSRYPYEVVGIDNDPYVVHQAMQTNKKLGGYAKFVLIDAFDLDLFKDGFFDVAFSQGTMEHFNDQDISELLARQLKVAKFVVFSVPSVNWDSRDFGNERRMTIEDWDKILQNAGLEVIKITYYQNDWHVACVVGSPPSDD